MAKSNLDIYVEKYARKHDISDDEARKHALVKEVARYYDEEIKRVVVAEEIKTCV